jgi:hypothetical protein
MTMLATLLLAAVAAAPLLPDALSCGKPGAAGGLGSGTDMTRYTVDTTRFPDALCNDGTPAVFYYAPAQREEDRDKWIIFLQGGGSCGDGQACAERWCSFDTNFGMDKMTSSLTKESIRANGLLEPSTRNEFGTWNRVLVFYCSSDTWSGTTTATTEASLASGATVSYTIHLKGSFIVDAVFDTLRSAQAHRRRAMRPSRETSSAPWPDLDAATHVLFAGSSGGGNGVRNNADRIGERLRATNPSLVDYRVVIDAIGILQQSDLDYSRSTMCEEDPIGCDYETFTRAMRERTDLAFHRARGDASCETWHAANQPGSEWLCADNQHVVMHHLTTPWLLRADLQDQLIASSFVERNFGTLTDYGTKLEREMRALPVPEEPRAATPALFIPQCRHHESFTNDQASYVVRVDGLTFHDVVWNWWRGVLPQQAIRPFAGAGPAPECPNS